MSLQDLQNADEFLEQMLCGLQSGISWPDISASTVNGSGSGEVGHNKLAFPWDVDQSNFLATKLQQHQISVGTGDSGIFGNEIINASSFKSPSGDNPIQALFTGFSGSHQSNQTPEFLYQQAQSFGSLGNASGLMNQGPSTGGASAPGGGGGGSGSGPPAQPRQRIRARRGQATDPHSIAERLRRERIAERMKSLQELVPNANKTDKASMLDEIIDYVKFLQLQVKVLSMSRLGGAAAVAPPVAHISSEGGRDTVQVGVGASSSSNDTMTVAENQVVKLMEEDMGSAMQYLQGKGLCLMPISLATAISTATCHPFSARNNHPLLGGGAPSSPNLSGLTVQSANRVLPTEGLSVKDSTSVSKP